MNLFRSLETLPEKFRGCALSIGNFDGVHRGHARIVECLVHRARELQCPSVVLTFDPHPASLLRPGLVPPALTWTRRKAQLLAELGVDAMVAYPTDMALLNMTARTFFETVVRKGFQAKAMVEGTNFFFGHDRAGNTDLLEQLCRESAMGLDVVRPFETDGLTVSSSRIRALLTEGDIDRAADMLQRTHRIRGIVIRGAGRGASLGYPTANVGEIDMLLPGKGIYAGRAHVGSGQFPAAINVGPNPTFGEDALKIEAYLIGFDGDLYDQPIEVDFIARLRDIRRFDSAEQLVAAMDRDVQATLQTVGDTIPR